MVSFGVSTAGRIQYAIPRLLASPDAPAKALGHHSGIGDVSGYTTKR